jgi:DEAD/DEAH box helicase domain-containing protein
MDVENFLSTINWGLAGKVSIPATEAKYYSVQDLSLSNASKKLLGTFEKGIYLHQKDAIRLAKEGKNVCISTGTASGKTLAFQIAAIEKLSRDNSSRIMAIYPMKALGREQEERWDDAIKKAGLRSTIGRIDGGVTPALRHRVLSDSQIVVFTPDIIHAWLLSNLSNRKVISFLEKVDLIIVDEVHTYSGVFGSNSAYLFRRLQHLFHMLGKEPQFICASATIGNPEKHLAKLFGSDFSIITKEQDSSPKNQVDILLVNPPGVQDFLTEAVNLLTPLYEKTNSRFITFVDSRKQVELISSIIARNNSKEEKDDDESVELNDERKNADEIYDDSDEKPYVPEEIVAVLDDVDVLPYRAGYEEQDRSRIQERLTQGKLNGIISTSALELGIDIPYLETCVLIGVPPSLTSLQQRIGRIGRHSKGNVIVVNSGSVYDQAVFANPESILQRPLSESALYLENLYVQYIHALCLARLGGEHDQIESALNLNPAAEFSSKVRFPEKFIWLCNQERSGQIPRELQSMKSDSGDNPNYAFPLRDIETQFKVEFRQGPRIQPLGSLSYGQLMREAYPAAVYYYATMPYRVTKVFFNSKTVLVRKEKRYTTKPQFLPTMIFPNLQEEIYQSYSHSKVICFECHLQVRELINGLKERRGPTERIYSYPLAGEIGIYFDLPLFSRNYFTTGAIIVHPIFNQEKVDVSVIAQFLYEAFILLIPYERQDINFAADKFRIKMDPLKKDGKFIAIYDQIYGSLRLTSRVLEENVLNRILVEAKNIAQTQGLIEINIQTLDAFDTLIKSTNKPKQAVSLGQKIVSTLGNNYKRVILPKSKGVLLTINNEEFVVERVFLTPDGLRYEGKTSHQSTERLVPPIEHVKEIPGESKIGYYNFTTGLVEKLSQKQIKAIEEESQEQQLDTN